MPTLEANVAVELRLLKISNPFSCVFAFTAPAQFM